MVSRSQRKKVVAYIEEAVQDGMNVLTGGIAPPAGMPEDSAFVAPTLLDDVSEGSRVWKEEIFGPVLAVRSFSTEEEAVRMANDTEFGLANSVLSGDLARCDRVARRLRSGVVWQNCSQPLS